MAMAIVYITSVNEEIVTHCNIPIDITYLEWLLSG